MSRKSQQVLGMAIGLSGFVWLLVLDWRIGLAVFLALWGNNLEHTYR